MVAKGEVILPLLSLGGNLSESRDHLILLPGDQHGQCLSSVEVFGWHYRRCEGGCANRSSKL